MPWSEGVVVIRRTLDWKAACLFVRTDPQWRKHLFVGGLWLMLCPPVGWLMALGYRKEVVMNLVHGKQPVLPVWKGQHGFFFREGCKAVGIILSYFTPFFVGFWVLGMEPGVLWVDHLWAFVAFFAFIVVLAPVFLPAAPIWYVEQYDWVCVDVDGDGLVGCAFRGHDVCHSGWLYAGVALWALSGCPAIGQGLRSLVASWAQLHRSVGMLRVHDCRCIGIGPLGALRHRLVVSGHRVLL